MLADKVILIVPFLFGSIIGSFLNVCIYRIPLGLSVVSPPSRCPECGRRIPFYYNIPIFSYMLLMGRCCFCKAPLSFRYPMVEAMTGVFASALFLKFGFSKEFFIYSAFASSLIVVTFIDLKYQIIPDVISIPGIICGFVASFFISSPGAINSSIGIMLGGGILFCIAWGYHLITGSEGMGGGDIKLLAMIGAFTGWKGVLITVLTGSFTGAAIGIIVMVFSGKNSKYPIPFGPFLAAGAITYLFFGERMISWYIMRAAGG